jgi:hypothetical protein
MNRKPIMLTLLTACIAAAAMLTAPPAVAGGGWGHYDCSQKRELIYKSRRFNSKMLQIYNAFDDIATDIIEDCIEDLQANAGASPGTLHSIAADCETELGHYAILAEYFLHHIRVDYLYGAADICPRLFGRNIAFNYSMIKRLNIRQAALRDQLKAALAAALAAP